MEKILILNLGGSSARRLAVSVRECSVYCDMAPFDMPLEEIKNGGYKGIILAGNEYKECKKELFEMGLPVLAVGMGANVLVEALGGENTCGERECGVNALQLDSTCVMLQNVPARTECVMEHELYISRVPTGFRITARTLKSAVAAMENVNSGIYVLQFEADTFKGEAGLQMIKNFLYKACGCHAEWTPASFIRRSVSAIGELLDGRRILAVLTGKYEEEVTALLLQKAVGSGVTCLFVDSGLLRQGESERIRELFSEKFGNNFYAVSAAERFAGKLIGITDSNTKERICKEEFLRIFEEEAAKMPPCLYLAAGSVENSEPLVFGEYKGVIEPLHSLLCEEVADIGKMLCEGKNLCSSGYSGLAAFVEGEADEDKIETLRKADVIFSKNVPVFKAYTTLLQDGKTVVLHAKNKDGSVSAVPMERLSLIAAKIKETTCAAQVVYEV